MLAVYRELIATRAALFGEAAGFEWLPADRDLVAFRRGDAVCVLNLGGAPVSLAGMPMLGGRVLTTATDPGDDDRVVAPDSASWYRLASSFVPAGADESPEPSSARRTTAIHRRASVTR